MPLEFLEALLGLHALIVSLGVSLSLFVYTLEESDDL